MADSERQQFDVIVVGGGTAGCIIASRLSSNPDLQVALIEAGEDTLPGHQDDVIWDSYPIVAYFDPRHHWRRLRVFYGEAPTGDNSAGGIYRYEQARVMGGGSSINGMMANQGAPGDYDEWAALGAAGWEWDQVLPYFCRLERDLDIRTERHGAEGPIPIRRVPESEWPEFSRVAGRALGRAGLSRIDDQNDGFEQAWFPITINNEHDRRVSTAAGYLTVEVRQRPNLTILSDATVTRIAFDGSHVSGVDVRDRGGFRSRVLAAREVVVAAGAIHTPALLMRSGVGPAAELSELGIGIVADRQGVGQNLQEHPQIAVTSLLKPEARQPWSQRRHIFAGFRYSSGIENCADVDMYGVVVNRGGWHSLGQKLGGFLIWVNKAYSQGRVSLVTPAVLAEPRVEFRFLSDERDLLRLTDGLLRLARLYQDPEMRRVTYYPFATAYSEKSRDLAIVRRSTEWKLGPVAKGIDGPASVRRRLMRRRVASGPNLFEIVRDQAELEAFVQRGLTVRGIVAEPPAWDRNRILWPSPIHPGACTASGTAGWRCFPYADRAPCEHQPAGHDDR
ncbi:MAG: GMC family oxidoreductase [Thermomicrobiales bacterium]|nr:GMC family oxidoreductase [Thermomicrobiales bacterium]